MAYKTTVAPDDRAVLLRSSEAPVGTLGYTTEPECFAYDGLLVLKIWGINRWVNLENPECTWTDPKWSVRTLPPGTKVILEATKMSYKFEMLPVPPGPEFISAANLPKGTIARVVSVPHGAVYVRPGDIVTTYAYGIINLENTDRVDFFPDSLRKILVEPLPPGTKITLEVTK